MNDPGDSDFGPNELQNYPVITGVQTGASTRVTGGLESTPNATFTIDFYADAGSSPINPGESIRFLDSVDVTTDATGLATFDVTLSVTTVADELVSDRHQPVR